jgi:hypothetical protein
VSWSHGLCARQSPAGNDLSGRGHWDIRHQATTSEDTGEWENLARAVVICKVYKSARLLELLVVTIYKISVNTVINRNLVTA